MIKNNKAMNKEQIEELFIEIESYKGIVNLDADDIRKFKHTVEFIDGEKLNGTNDQVGVLLYKAMRTIQSRHIGQRFTHLLFSINTSPDNTFTIGHLNSTSEVMDDLDIECVW